MADKIKFESLVQQATLADFPDCYLFHTTGLRGVAALVVVSASKVKAVKPAIITFSGEIVFNGEKQAGYIAFNRVSRVTELKLKGIRKHIRLEIDPAKQQSWSEYIQHCEKEIECKIFNQH